MENEATKTAPEQESRDEGTAESIDSMSPEEFARYIAALQGGDSLYSGEPEPEPEETEDDEPEETKDTENEEDPEPAEEPPQEPSQPEQEPPRQPVYRSFGTQEEYNAAINAEVRRRTEAAQREANEEQELFRAASREYFGGDVSNPYSKTADDMIKQIAEERKITEDEVRSRLKTNINAERYENQRKQQDQINRQRNAIIENWQKEADVLSKIYPAFDYKASLSNPAFASVLQRGGSVVDAYKAMIEATPAPPPKKKPRKEVSQEGQKSRRSGSEGSPNPANLSQKEFDKYIDKCRNS